MKRLTTVLLVIAVACHRGAATPGAGSVTGATTPETAVNAFLAAATAKDLQAMSAVWGTAKGPVRDHIPIAELDMRELIMIRMLCHETARILDNSPGIDGTRMLRVELKRPSATAVTTFTTVKGPANRWYVSDLDTGRLQGFCR